MSFTRTVKETSTKTRKQITLIPVTIEFGRLLNKEIFLGRLNKSFSKQQQNQQQNNIETKANNTSRIASFNDHNNDSDGGNNKKYENSDQEQYRKQQRLQQDQNKANDDDNEDNNDKENDENFDDDKDNAKREDEDFNEIEFTPSEELLHSIVLFYSKCLSHLKVNTIISMLFEKSSRSQILLKEIEDIDDESGENDNDDDNGDDKDYNEEREILQRNATTSSDNSVRIKLDSKITQNELASTKSDGDENDDVDSAFVSPSSLVESFEKVVTESINESMKRKEDKIDENIVHLINNNDTDANVFTDVKGNANIDDLNNDNICSNSQTEINSIKEQKANNNNNRSKLKLNFNATNSAHKQNSSKKHYSNANDIGTSYCNYNDESHRIKIINVLVNRHKYFRNVLYQRKSKNNNKKNIEIFDRVIACLTFLNIQRQSNVNTIFIPLIAVIEKYRFNGIGKFLIERLKKSLSPSRYVIITNVNQQNERFFLKCDFTDDTLINERYRSSEHLLEKQCKRKNKNINSNNSCCSNSSYEHSINEMEKQMCFVSSNVYDHNQLNYNHSHIIKLLNEKYVKGNLTEILNIYKSCFNLFDSMRSEINQLYRMNMRKDIIITDLTKENKELRQIFHLKNQSTIEDSYLNIIKLIDEEANNLEKIYEKCKLFDVFVEKTGKIRKLTRTLNE